MESDLKPKIFSLDIGVNIAKIKKIVHNKAFIIERPVDTVVIATAQDVILKIQKSFTETEIKEILEQNLSICVSDYNISDCNKLQILFDQQQIQAIDASYNLLKNISIIGKFVQELDLQNNFLGEGEFMDSILQFPQLKLLNIANNQITKLKYSSLSEQSLLTNIDLSGNKIQKLEDIQTIAELMHLTDLNLCENKISKLCINIPMPFPRLQSLLLCDNKILYADDLKFLLLLPTLQVLDLSCNDIRSFVGQTGGLQLEELILASNHLMNDGSLEVMLGFPKLWLLGLSGNNIRRLPANVTNKTLELLDLSDNSISSAQLIPFVSKLKELGTLDVSENPLNYLQTLSNVVMKTEVCVLTVSKSFTSIIEYDFSKLKQLDLSGFGHLTGADVQFAFAIWSLEELDLSDNGLRNMSRIIGGMTIQKLSMSGNRLSVADVQRLGQILPKLKCLQLNCIGKEPQPVNISFNLITQTVLGLIPQLEELDQYCVQCDPARKTALIRCCEGTAENLQLQQRILNEYKQLAVNSRTIKERQKTIVKIVEKEAQKLSVAVGFVVDSLDGK